ncbi:MAG TPA: LutB/LldF family L-lactate oxidation iron-sulfur protein [Tepidisphaeraceae bacterium]|nr:LutB/LldF family L-lactate oxidation iron-sulfur protein [Tepidisphaeraceae bacterium]
MADVLDKPIDPHTAEFLHEAEASKFDFHEMSTKAAGDERLKRAINFAVLKQDIGRRGALAELPDSEAMRNLAGAIKQHTLDHLDYYLEQLAERVHANGGQVHFASTGDEARRIVLGIAKKGGCKRVIKSKSMASEEIELTGAMEAAGLEVFETDLGEFIIQLAHEKPSHLVAPIVHKDVASIAKLFSEHFKTPYSEDPNTLTALAREFLRDKFRHADLGMTGGNFLVAESGQVCVVENEGNARQSITSPRVLVSVVGIEKVIPRVADLSVFLKLLARSATGQVMTIDTHLFGGPRAAAEKDGPEDFHLVLLDNGRTGILAGEYRETLRCIRCAACLNACPIYRNIGGHAYGSIYPGPIGALITPLFQGLGTFKDLPQASSLCGACYEACPVKINIPRHLINLRRDIVSRHINGNAERFIYRVWARLLGSPAMYRWTNSLQKWELRRRAHKTGWVRKLPMVAAGWTQVRDMPAPAKKTFHELWKKRP